jgi:hypothetical protein
MRVLANLEDREISVWLSPGEKEKLKGKFMLKNVGVLYEYDDGVEYCCSYIFTLRKLSDYYLLSIEREDAGGAIHRYIQVKFKDYDEFNLAIAAFTRCKCASDVRFCTRREEELASKHVVASKTACATLIDFASLIPILMKMVRIARALRLF